MKKFTVCTILIMLALALCLPLSAATLKVASAESATYIEIPDAHELADLKNASVSAVPFCDAASFEPLFYIPTTYFVKVNGFVKSVKIGDRYNVSYGGLTGCVFVSDFATAPTPAENATVDSKGEAPELVLTYKGDAPTAVGEANVDSSWTLTFYGEDAADSSKVYAKCVKADTTVFGSIAKDKLANFLIPLHQVTLDAIAASTTADEPDGTVTTYGFGNDQVVKTVLIVGIIIPAVLIIILLFKPRKRTDNYDRYERNMRGPSKYDSYGGRDSRRGDYDRYEPRRAPDDDYYRPRDYRDDDRY